MDNTDHSKPYVIGISGGSGSGKTSFVNDLIGKFDKDLVSILTMDNYYLERDSQLTDERGVKNFDRPASIDIPQFKKDFEKLSSGASVTRMEYTFNNQEAEEREVTIKPASVLILEGLFIYSEKEISDLIDLKIIVNVKDVVKIIRRIKRDKLERNYPIEDVIYRYEHHVLPSFEKYIYPYLDTVDLIINNNDNYNEALDLLGSHVATKLTN